MNDWDALQEKISSCTLCKGKFPEVDCPPGEMHYPSPQQPVKILFVGAAPPKKGEHFYTDEHDGLRQQLFKLLSCLGYPCNNACNNEGIDDFLSYGFFLSHTAKCAREGTTKPKLGVSRLCSSHHLKKEVEHLLPDAIVFLRQNIGYKVCEKLCMEWGFNGYVPFGELTRISIKGKLVYLLPTFWPGRGNPPNYPRVKKHLEKLFSVLKKENNSIATEI